MDYAELVQQAGQVPIEGWDFGIFGDRFTADPLSWDYREVIAPHLEDASSALDMGTGGGEFLASLAQLPSRMVATEGYPPNVPVARERLEPLGVEVVQTKSSDDAPLPFTDDSFDIVINRHEAFVASEVRRVLLSGGVFVTQQVGGGNLAELNQALDAPTYEYAGWDLSAARVELEMAGFEIADQREDVGEARFSDIGAVALYLRMVPWQIRGFSVAGYDARLRSLHARLAADGPLRVSQHRFLLVARS